MARQRIEWNLSGVAGMGIVSLKELKVSVPTEKGSEKKIEGSATIIGRVLDTVKFRELAEAAYNKGKKDADKVSLTYEFLLADFVNSVVVATKKAELRTKANPAVAVKNAIENLRKKFPNVSDEKLAAMAEMLKDSIG